MNIPTHYLSPLGRAIVNAHAQRMRADLAKRRVERELQAALGPVREAESSIPVGEATESSFGAFIGADAEAP